MVDFERKVGFMGLCFGGRAEIVADTICFTAGGENLDWQVQTHAHKCLGIVPLRVIRSLSSKI